MSRSDGGRLFTTAVADADLAGGDPLEPRDHAQECGLTAARRAYEDDELSIGDIEVQPVDDLKSPIVLAQVADRYVGHVASPSKS